MKIYIGCSLTYASEEFKQEIEELKNILRKDYEILDFVWLVDWTCTDVYNWDTNCVKSCDLMIAECSYPSIGLWYELWLWNSLKKPIFAIAKKDAKVTRLVQWINSLNYTFIRYNEHLSEILPLLEKKIEEIKKQKNNSQKSVYFDKKNFWDYFIETYVKHHYKSDIIDIEYLDDDENELMKIAENNKLDIVDKLEKKWFWKVHVTSVVYWKDWKFISAWTNSEFHLDNWCVRKELKSKSWEWYELCVWCQPINHWEQIAIKHAIENWKYDELNWATAYMYWHYWACEWCTKAMEKAWIKKLFISKSFTKEFLNIKDI